MLCNTNEDKRKLIQKNIFNLILKIKLKNVFQFILLLQNKHNIQLPSEYRTPENRTLLVTSVGICIRISRPSNDLAFP